MRSSLAAAEAIARGVRQVLLHLARPDLAAIWLYGASVFGHPVVDVDMHILLRRELKPEEWKAVHEAHVRLAREFGLRLEDLDLWYISLQDAYRAEDPTHLAPWAPNLRDRHWALHRAHWLAGKCEVVYGLEPHDVVLRPTWEELEAVLRRELDVAEPSAYWVLQLCRVWASLATRDVVRSKIDSGRWALERLAPEHHDVVLAAVRAYQKNSLPGDGRLIRARFPALLAEVRRQISHVR